MHRRIRIKGLLDMRNISIEFSWDLKKCTIMMLLYAFCNFGYRIDLPIKATENTFISSVMQLVCVCRLYMHNLKLFKTRFLGC